MGGPETGRGFGIWPYVMRKSYPGVLGSFLVFPRFFYLSRTSLAKPWAVHALNSFYAFLTVADGKALQDFALSFPLLFVGFLEAFSDFPWDSVSSLRKTYKNPRKINRNL